MALQAGFMENFNHIVVGYEQGILIDMGGILIPHRGPTVGAKGP